MLSFARDTIIHRFAHFTGVGVFVLGGEVILLALLYYVFDLPYFASVAFTFLFVFSISYFAFRKYAFYGSERSKLFGYINFILIATIGLTIITGGTYLVVSYTDIHELIARILIGMLSGTVNFFVNALINFRVLGH
ncbi:GtrA family protein [Candidatus Pacebacteria bacterium]|nr:GtrA family protein [Candidatus Paceibacterota bacterium]